MNYNILDYHYSNGKSLGEFKGKNEVMKWILEGLMCCDGCERDPYVNVLIDLWTTNRKNLRFV